MFSTTLRLRYQPDEKFYVWPGFRGGRTGSWCYWGGEGFLVKVSGVLEGGQGFFLGEGGLLLADEAEFLPFHAQGNLDGAQSGFEKGGAAFVGLLGLKGREGQDRGSFFPKRSRE